MSLFTSAPELGTLSAMTNDHPLRITQVVHVHDDVTVTAARVVDRYTVTLIENARQGTLFLITDEGRTVELDPQGTGNTYPTDAYPYFETLFDLAMAMVDAVELTL